MVWRPLGAGAYNTVYINGEGTLVFKVQKIYGDRTDDYDTPKRSIRLMAELYPDMALSAQLHEDSKLGKGWTFPFIEGRPAEDAEMIEAIIDIFNRTGRIMLDGCINRNFVRTSASHPTYPNRTFCIDVGMAVRLQKEEEVIVNKKPRRRSETSHDIQKHQETRFHRCLWSHHNNKDLTSTHLIQALLLIREYKPDIVDVSVLKNNHQLIKKLGSLYQENLAKVLSPEKEQDLVKRTDEALTELEAAIIARRELDAIIAKAQARTRAAKETCRNLLNAYIKTRGVIDEKTNAFKPSFTTYWFRNRSLTLFKVQNTQTIISAINSADSIEALKTVLQSAQRDKRLMQSSFHSGLKGALIQCEKSLNQNFVITSTSRPIISIA